jgi:16S rRNA (uracil1498-N3)-methyltransferase
VDRVKAHAFVDDLGCPALADGDRHHLLRVLRLRPAEVISVSDGSGGVRTCRLARDGELEPLDDVRRTVRPQPAITVGFALVKGERPEWVVQKLTELGVDRIVPFVADRSVVRWEPPKAARNAERLTAISRDAAMQSRRLWLPVVESATTLPRLVEASGTGVARGDWDGETPGLSCPTILVGPEGGWSDLEREILPRAVRLGDGILRAETAALAAGVLFTALRSELTLPARAQ